MSRKRTARAGQGGAILLLAMAFLLLLAMLAGSAMHTSILELRMAGNGQFREQAQQQAWAIASAITDYIDNFPLDRSVGSKICRPSITAAECDRERFIKLTSNFTGGLEAEYWVRRMGPLSLPSLPFRKPQGTVSSHLAFDVAVFESHVVVGGAGGRFGRAEAVRGVAVLHMATTGSSAE